MKTVVVAILALASGYQLGARKDHRQAILDADRAFDARTAERGVEGWVSFFAEDGKMIRSTTEVVKGHAAIRELMGPLFADKNNSLRWEPEYGEAARSGDLGYTIGRSKFRGRNAEGKTVERDGRYVTIWRNTGSGWKAALDIGSSTPLRVLESN